MKEIVLHYIWHHKLFRSFDQYSTVGESVEIVDVGKPNYNSGPDFFNAKIRIGDTLWVGNVEIHLRSSDWYKHQHQHDAAYDNVILHVVKYADVEVALASGVKIAQLELVYPEEIEKKYSELLESRQWIPCSNKLNMIDSLILNSWKEALLAERLTDKVAEVRKLLYSTNHHWEEVFFHILCKSFGFSVNGDAFLALARSVEWQIVRKCSHDRFVLEALFFGQSGLLQNAEPVDEYVHKLNAEYLHLKRKFSLEPMDATMWKMLRIRPDNFPYIRISQLVSLIYAENKLFNIILNANDLNELRTILSKAPSAYWNSHYMFAKKVKEHQRTLGARSINSLIVNSIVPVMFEYGIQTSSEDLKEKALLFLQQLPAEENYLVRHWREAGIIIKSAYDSQAFIQLSRRYCEDKKCLRCRIGHKVLTTECRIK